MQVTELVSGSECKSVQVYGVGMYMYVCAGMGIGGCVSKCGYGVG